MQLPTWFIVFIVLGIIVLAMVILVAVRPSVLRIWFLKNQTNEIDLCKEWTKEGCENGTEAHRRLEDSGYCTNYSTCLEECYKYGLCWS